MIKKLLVLVTTLLFSTSFAVTEQIKSSKEYLLKNNIKINEENAVALAPKKELSLNSKNSLILTLQKQLQLNETGVLDKETLSYIKNFQKDNDFNVSNTLDYNTWFALFEQNQDWKNKVINSSLMKFNEIIELQKKRNSSKFIVVNIPTMSLIGYEWDGKEAKEAIYSKVIIGKPKTQTPIKNFDIISLKYNPNWTPTNNIIKRNLFKNHVVDNEWITNHDLRVFSNGVEIDPSEIIEGKDYKFIQPSGDKNALGVLKFETNSPDKIYLHDTNEKHLFNKNTRAYSSGCIRVQDFINLADWLKNSDNTSEKLSENKNTFFEKIEKTPVYITYNQVIFYGEDPLFAPDIYNINGDTLFQK